MQDVPILKPTNFFFFLQNQSKPVLNSLYLKPSDVYEVTDAVNTLNPHKSLSVDDNSSKLINAAKHVLSSYLLKLINYCLKNGRYFGKLEIARVTLHYHRGFEPDLQNYCSISVLASFNKISEAIIKKRLLKF